MAHGIWRSRVAWEPVRHCLGLYLVVATFFFGMRSADGQRAPHIGYAYPAGGQQGASFEVEVGGQSLGQPGDVVFSGEGVEAEVIDHHKMPNNQTLGEIRKKVKDFKSKSGAVGRSQEKAVALLAEVGLTEKEVWQLAVNDLQGRDPKRQKNAQIAESLRLRVTVADDAEPGMRDLRVMAAGGISNPIRFAVGQYPNIVEYQPFDQFDVTKVAQYSNGSEVFAAAKKMIGPFTPPATVNGRILPGEVDMIRFHARCGDQIVVAVEARSLIPYLADAVPGWFQAYVSLFAPDGKEMAFGGSYLFDPDPVLFYKVPSDGEYRIGVRDSIYRGREDFVYRITVGELPFLTGISPLGGGAGSRVDLVCHGGNLDAGQKQQRLKVPEANGVLRVSAGGEGERSNTVPFQVDSLPEFDEREMGGTLDRVNWIDEAVMVNGRIDEPGDVDYFRVRIRGEGRLVLEVHARRLNSPLDARLTVTNASGDQVSFSDDYKDPAYGLVTHHADPRILLDVPSGGDFLLALADTQSQGGAAYAYRLRISPPRLGFELRATPSGINARAGGSAQVTVHALRLDGYDGAINVSVAGAEPGVIAAREATIPAGKDMVKLSFPVDGVGVNTPVALRVCGTAEIGGKLFEAVAVPAEDTMQAFLYRHLVPVDDLVLCVRPAAKE